MVTVKNVRRNIKVNQYARNIRVSSGANSVTVKRSINNVTLNPLNRNIKVNQDNRDISIQQVRRVTNIHAVGRRGPQGLQGPQGIQGTQGVQGDFPDYTFNEVPSGVMNGVNKIFTTMYAYIPNSTRIFLNGIRQSMPDDYTESGDNEITFTDAPSALDIINVDYFNQ